MSEQEPDDTDLTADDLAALMAKGTPLVGVPTGWRCEHMTITGYSFLGQVAGPCGCDMEPMWATRTSAGGCP